MKDERIVWRYEKSRRLLYNAFSLLAWIIAFVFAEGALAFYSVVYSLLPIMGVGLLADSEFYPFAWSMVLSFWWWLTLAGVLLGAAILGSGAVMVAGAVCSFAYRMGGKHSRILPTVVFVCGAAFAVYIAWHFCGGSAAGIVSAILVSAVALACYAAMGVFVWRLCSKAENEFYDC